MYASARKKNEPPDEDSVKDALYRELEAAKAACEAARPHEQTEARERLVDLLIRFHAAVFRLP